MCFIKFHFSIHLYSYLSLWREYASKVKSNGSSFGYYLSCSILFSFPSLGLFSCSIVLSVSRVSQVTTFRRVIWFDLMGRRVVAVCITRFVCSCLRERKREGESKGKRAGGRGRVGMVGSDEVPLTGPQSPFLGTLRPVKGSEMFCSWNCSDLLWTEKQRTIPDSVPCQYFRLPAVLT